MCTKYHSGYSACSKCTQTGVRYENRIVFSDKIETRRTDETFGNPFSLDDDHYRGTTILSELGIGLVSRLPLESMHLIYLGVVKKLLNLWVGGKPKYIKLSSFQVSTISDRLQSLRFHICSEFNRQSRSLVELPRWKATELRQFLLYTGYIVLQNILPSEYLKHFLTLQCAVTIYSSDKLIRDYGNYANQLLEYFVVQFSNLYGRENLVYNIYGLLHVHEDVKEFGNLNNYSAFAFENYLGVLKRLKRGGFSSLSQVCRRLSERDTFRTPVKLQNLTHIHSNGPILGGLGDPQYKTLLKEDFIVKINKRDQFVKLRSGELIKVRNFATDLKSGEVCIIANACQNISSFFASPCDSTLLGIFTFTKFGPLQKFSLSDIEQKYLVLPNSLGGFAALPLIHTN